MREVILDMEQLSDSREVLEQKIPRSTTSFLAIISIVILVALVWAYFGKMEKYVSGVGEIRPMNYFTLTGLSGGKITAKNFNNGSTVQAGDLLVEFDGAFQNQQKKALETQNDELSFKIECYNKLIKSIEEDRNRLSSTGAEAQYYYQFESYRLEAQAPGADRGQVKAAYYTSFSNSRDTYTEMKNNLKIELLSLEQSLKELVVVAPSDGIIEWTQSFQVGDTLAPATVLGTVVPSTQDMQVVISIAEGDIANIEVGQTVEYWINSPQQKGTEKIYGKVVSISSDVFFVGEGNGQRFYRVEATLSVSAKNQVSTQLRAGMSVQAHVSDGQQNVMEWLFSKMGF
ncbi:MAG: HlyD family efflux transporter periplasmic adaptor subunit [Peptococcaceae bacterium]|nr:HlyD family efflux transporter periplasmic adaptor subunit [Peptococcaceae bacterium]